MANEYMVNSADLTSVANAIRATNWTSDYLVFPEEFVSAIQANERNFKVVGGRIKPSDPKENTIWLSTNVEITEYAFAAKNPFMSGTELTIQAKHGTTNGSSTDIVIIDNSDGTTIASQTIKGTTSYSEFTNVAISFKTSNGLDGILTCSVKKTSPFFTGTVTVNNVVAGTVEFGTATNSSYVWSGEQNVIVEGNEETKLGQVWIGSNTNRSLTAFSVTKNNPIMVHPIFVKQYTTNGWESIEAKIFQNGEWVDLLPGVLYSYGIEYVKWTGFVTKGPTSLNCTNASNFQYTHTAEKIDITGFNTLEITLETKPGTGSLYQYPAVGISSTIVDSESSSGGSVTVIASHTFSQRTFNGTISIPLTGQSGLVYVYIRSARTSTTDETMRVYDVRLK